VHGRGIRSAVRQLEKLGSGMAAPTYSGGALELLGMRGELAERGERKRMTWETSVKVSNAMCSKVSGLNGLR